MWANESSLLLKASSSPGGEPRAFRRGRGRRAQRASAAAARLAGGAFIGPGRDLLPGTPACPGEAQRAQHAAEASRAPGLQAWLVGLGCNPVRC